MTCERGARIVVVCVLVVVAAAGAYQFVDSLGKTLDRAEDFRSQGPNRRAIAGARLLDIDPEWITAVRAFVQPGDRFVLETGPRLTPSTRLTFRFLPAYVYGALLPALPGTPEDANWLLCYGCEHESFSRFTPVWVDGGYVIGRKNT